MEKKEYPVVPSEYKILEEIGYGLSAVVFRALCVPFNEVVAIKSIDLEKSRATLEEIRREALTLSLIEHQNVVKAYCSFIVDDHLWVVMSYMAGGSCLNIMRSISPHGFEESVIATVLKEVLKGLDYLHSHGHIHRDVKAGNILIDSAGNVKLADFGVSAFMFDVGDRLQMKRSTFVGTPCWMAPEVLEQVNGYDFKADIWSFGITALELAQGHAPLSNYPPLKVFMLQLQNPPPALDHEREKHYSKSFKELVAMCLVKDPAKRPTAEKLLKNSFFKHAKSGDYLVRHLLDGLPPLWVRVRALKIKDDQGIPTGKSVLSESSEMENSLSNRRLSSWEFSEELGQILENHAEGEADHSDESKVSNEESQMEGRKDPRCSHEDEGDMNAEFPHPGPIPENDLPVKYEDVRENSSQILDPEWGRQLAEKLLDHSHFETDGENQNLGAEPLDSICLKVEHRTCHTVKTSVVTGKEISDDKMKAPVIHKKGRFSVTEEDILLVDSISSQALMQKVCTSTSAVSYYSQPLELENPPFTVPASEVLPHLQSLLHNSFLQQDRVLNLINSLTPNEAKSGGCSNGSENSSAEISAQDKERELLQEIADLQNKAASLTDEILGFKSRNAHLERQLLAFKDQHADNSGSISRSDSYRETHHLAKSESFKDTNHRSESSKDVHQPGRSDSFKDVLLGRSDCSKDNHALIKSDSYKENNYPVRSDSFKDNYQSAKPDAFKDMAKTDNHID